jgi:S-adenosylmethionine:tRNA ribosyltransferase-isomerase
MTELSRFDYELPEDLIAPAPAQRREGSRLLVLDRRSGCIDHRRFSDLPGLLRHGDLLVLNDARVLPARLQARRRSGGRVELLLVRPEPEGPGRSWLALVRAGGSLREGEPLRLNGTDADVELLEDRGDGYWTVKLADDESGERRALEAGGVPLPPYVRRARRRRGLPERMPRLDRERYQTVYARAPGAVAAPTAGLHFTKELLQRIRATGVGVRTLSLLVGPGTFRPVHTQKVEEHELEPERFRLPAATARAVKEALEEGRRVVATGTTTCRVLEYVARNGEW